MPDITTTKYFEIIGICILYMEFLLLVLPVVVIFGYLIFLICRRVITIYNWCRTQTGVRCNFLTIGDNVISNYNKDVSFIYFRYGMCDP